MSTEHLAGRRCHHSPAGSGPSRWIFGDRYTVKATRADTGGSVGMMEALVPPGGGPPPHVHTREDEVFYVLDGVVEALDGEEPLELSTGSCLFVPRGRPHAFRNVGDDPCRMLIMFVPGGNEQFFLDIGVSADHGAPPPPPSRYAVDLEEAQAIVADYGAYYL